MSKDEVHVPVSRPYVLIKLEEREISTLLDTGSHVCLMAEHLYNSSKELMRRFPLINCNIKLMGASGSDLKVLGKVEEVPFFIKSKEFKMTFIVLSNLKRKVVLGNNFLHRYNGILFIKNGVVTFNGVEASLIQNPQACWIVETSLEKRGVPNLWDEERLEKILQQIDVGDENTSEQMMKEVHKLITEFADIFILKGEILPANDVTVHLDLRHKIPIEETVPVPYHKQDLITNEINEMIAQGIIQPSTSNYSSKIFFLEKPGNEAKPRYRPVNDFRSINKLIKPLPVALPMVEEILMNWVDQAVFSVLDCSKAFFQMSLDEESRQYTAFTIHGKKRYEYLRLPQGLSVSPHYMQALVNRVVKNLGSKVQAYVDDFSVGALNDQEMLELLRQLFHEIRVHKLCLSPAKCNLMKRKVRILGFEVSQQGVAVSPDRIEAIVNMKPPKTVRDCRSFLGVVNYLRKHIGNLTEDATGLMTDLDKNIKAKRSKFVLSAEGLISFNSIKEAIKNSVILAFPPRDVTLSLYCDASQRAVGSVLLFYDEQGIPRPVAFHSQKVPPSLAKNHSTYLELWSLKVNCEKFHRYLIGRKFFLFTDNKTLIGQNFLNKSRTAMYIRWIGALAAYDFELKHVSSVKNVIADTLSRFNYDRAEEDTNRTSVDKVLDQIVDYGNEIERVAMDEAKEGGNEDGSEDEGKEGNKEPEEEKEEGKVDIMDVTGELEGMFTNLIFKKNGDNLDWNVYTGSNVSDQMEYFRLEELLEEEDKRSQHFQEWKEEDNPAQKPGHWSINRARDEEAIFLLEEYLTSPYLSKEQDKDIDLRYLKKAVLKNTQLWVDLKCPTRKIGFYLDKFSSLEVDSDNCLTVQSYRKFSEAPAKLIVIPEHLELPIISQAHNGAYGAAHLGADKLLSQLEDSFSFMDMKDKVMHYVGTCDPCQKLKIEWSRKHRYPLQSYTSREPFETLHVDVFYAREGQLVNKQKYNYAIVIVDNFSGFMYTAPFKELRTTAVLRELMLIFSIFGIPLKLVVDKGSEMVSRLIQDSAQVLGIIVEAVSVAHHATNSHAEVSIKLLKGALKKRYVESPASWSDELGFIALTLNASLTKRHEFSPYNTVFGRNPRLPCSALWNIKNTKYYESDAHRSQELFYTIRKIWKIVESQKLKALEANTKYYNKKGFYTQFTEGELVYVKRPIPAGTTYRQLRLHYQGPFVIHKVIGQGTYVVKGGKGNLWEVHHDNMYKCRVRGEKEVIQEIPQTKTIFPSAITSDHSEIIKAWEELPGVNNEIEESKDLNDPVSLRRGDRNRKPPDRLNYLNKN